MKSDKKKFNDQGWCIFEITTPAGVSFKLAFKDSTLRIRRQGWVPIEIDSIKNTCTEVHIRTDTLHTQFLDDEKEIKEDAGLDNLSHYSTEEGFGE